MTQTQRELPTEEALIAALATANEANPRRAHGCPECGKPAMPKSLKGPAPLFCSKECKVACERRKLADGRVIIDQLKAWRACRNNKADASLGGALFSEICSTLDKMMDRDRQGGRTTARLLGYVERVGSYNHDWFTQSHNIRFARDHRAQQEAAPEPQPEPQPDPLAEILRQIAEGHNDPRQLAAAALAQREG